MHYDLTTSGADLVAQRLRGQPGIRKLPNALLHQFIAPNFLSPDQCTSLIAQIDAGMQKSTLVDDEGDPEFRTSSTCHLDHREPLVQAVDTAICTLLGIDGRYGEPLQGQCYQVGQEFKAHTDYFEPSGLEYEAQTAVSGQRTWTAMAYLNRVESGGATRFQHTGKIHQPEAGKLLLWCNLDDNGSVNPWTLHHGMKVRKGRKYILTKWFRERAWPWG
jgi:prolyl 4-hydroxylase